jgi:hypothetical protein
VEIVRKHLNILRSRALESGQYEGQSRLYRLWMDGQQL